MYARPLLILFFLTLTASLFAQYSGKYRVHFTDKQGVRFDPHAYFNDKAIERRKKHGIPLDHPSDRPLKPSYVERVRGLVDTISTRSRWFNLVYVRTVPEKIPAIGRLDGVERVTRVRTPSSVPASSPSKGDYDSISSERHRRIFQGQTASLGIEKFHDEGLKGNGVRVAVLDNGFKSVDENPAFDHIRSDGRILATRDFVQSDTDVFGHGSHGTMVLSCIGGMTRKGEPIGLAPEAEFLLARTERSLWEPFSEEENWLKALEWADKKGADIINSSLGYIHHRYFPREMDGETSFIAKAAAKAVDKGILVVNAAGNSGSNDWKIIGTPADVDSVLSIGGTEPRTGVHTSFSSYGPTADGRMKPNLSAYGHVIASGPDGMTKTQGTSFSSPLVAGFAACALQSDSSMEVSELFNELERSGDLYPYYDYAHGYGTPQASHFTEGPKKEEARFRIERSKDSILVHVKPSVLDTAESRKKGETEEEGDEGIVIGTLPEEHNGPFLYHHIENAEGELEEYSVIEVNQELPVRFGTEILKGGKKLRIHFQGVTKTIER